MGKTMAEQRAGSRSMSRLVLIPAFMGATAAGTLTALWPSTARDKCTALGLDCAGAALLVLVVGIPLAFVVTCAVLAWCVGAWQAPTITLGGGAVAAYSLQFIGRDGAESLWIATTIGGVSFAAVAIACLPGLSRVPRWGTVGLLVLMCVAATVGGR